jgi:hypothetical protein
LLWLGVLGVAALIVAGLIVGPAAAEALADEPDRAGQLGQRGLTLQQPGQPDRPGRPGLAALAAALGISEAELLAAEQEALAAAVADAEADGRITAEEADQILAQGHAGRLRRFLGRPGERQVYLVAALGITDEEWRAARLEAHQALISAGLASGRIGPEQAALRQAAAIVRAEVDQHQLAADALGLTVAELEAALAGGATRATLAEAAGLSQAELRLAVQDAFAAAVRQLAAEGRITAEQAELIIERRR